MGLFPDPPPDIKTVDDDALATLLEEMVGVAERVNARDEELLGDITMGDLVEEMTRGVEQIEAVRAELATRDAAAAEAEDKISELAARALAAQADEPVEGDDTDDGDTPDPEAKTDDDEVEEPEPVETPAEPVAIAASSRRVAATPRRSREYAPRQSDPRRGTIIASADGIGYSPGAEIPDLRSLSEAMLKKHEAFQGRGGSKDGGVEDITIARLKTVVPEDRQLSEQMTPMETWNRIDSVVGREALVAAGGLCSPTEGYYDVQLISSDMRPVRDSLPRFTAARGGIRFAAPPALSAVTTGVGLMTAANDAIGGTTATKTCQTVACPSILEVKTNMVYHCLKFGNLGGRAFPEFVDQFTELALAAQARIGETAILDQIGACSTAVTGAQVGGANNTLLGQILTAAAGMRSRHRMDPNARLRVLLPAWVREALVTDLVRSQFGRWDWSIAGVEALLRNYNVEPTFYLDGATGAGQVFGTQTAAALLGYPTTAVWYIFAEGSFIFIDGGVLDLGIVRDSTLNATNDFSIFGESFEITACAGVESLKVTSTFCATGEVTLPRTLSCAVGP